MLRRTFLGAAAALFGLSAYSINRGLRIPPMIWEPRPLSKQSRVKGVQLDSSGFIQTRIPVLDTPVSALFRAFVPEPELRLEASADQTLTLSLNNLSTEAELLVEGPSSVEVSEEIEGITRVLTIKTGGEGVIWLRWQLAKINGFRFAAIGDSGGQQELRWCIQRASDLGALFFLHLGDFYYTKGDYESSIEAFNNAPIPCYVSIGNHDFRDGKNLYQQFLDEIGPLNASFSLGGARFINVDTANNFIPYGAGQRGKMLRTLSNQAAAVSNIAFTHRPLFDPIEGSSHDIGSTGERDWLIKALQNCQVNTLISGHIHIHARATVAGIDNIIVGQGLGHQDLITNRDYSKMALGRIDSGGQLSMSFANLAMPWDHHCHPRNDVVKESLKDAPHKARIEALDKVCLPSEEA